jgi:CBS domain-containing protein
MDELATLRDEVKLSVHLAGMDAKSEWEALQPKLRELETKIEGGSDKAAKLAADVSSTLRKLRERLRDPSVSDVMTSEVFTCSGGDSVHRALQLMWDHDIGIVPVHDEAGMPVGVVTDRDVAMAGYTRGELPMGNVVYTVMSNELHTCRHTDRVSEAMKTMRDARVRRLLVVDEEGRLVGVMSLGDVVRWATSAGSTRQLADAGTTLAAISKPRK